MSMDICCDCGKHIDTDLCCDFTHPVSEETLCETCGQKYQCETCGALFPVLEDKETKLCHDCALGEVEYCRERLQTLKEEIVKIGVTFT